MMKNKKIPIIVCLLLVAILSIGASKIVTLDTEANKVYQDVLADTVISLFQSGKDLCKNKYNGEYLMLLGEVENKASNNKSIDLTGFDEKGTVIKCSTSNSEFINRISSMKAGDSVCVYGKLTVDTWGSGSLKITIDNIYVADANYVSGTSYSMFDSTKVYHFDTTDYTDVSLAGGMVNYIVPNDWDRITNNLDKEYFYCNQYNLNQLPDNFSITAESLYVFYFDNEGLADLNDKTKTENIECAIVANILGFDPDEKIEFPYKEVKTYYGQEYDYYTGTFNSMTLNKSFHVEFVFTPVGKNEGICGFLYVYSEKNHLQDALFLMRKLTVASN